MDTKEKEWSTYFVRNDYNNWIKIGRTQDIDIRLRQLSASLPFVRITVLFYLKGDYEKMFHNHYKAQREFGEWFNIPEFCPVKFKKKCPGIIKKQTSLIPIDRSNPPKFKTVNAELENKVFGSIPDFKKLADIDKQVLMYFVAFDQIGKNSNVIFIDADLTREIAKYLKVDPLAVRHAITRLRWAKFFVKFLGGTEYVNPKFYWDGDKDEREGLFYYLQIEKEYNVF